MLSRLIELRLNEVAKSTREYEREVLKFEKMRRLHKWSAGIGHQPIKPGSHDDLLEALAKDFGQSGDNEINSCNTLKKVREASQIELGAPHAHNDNKDDKRNLFRIGFGHTMWAAPLPIALRNLEEETDTEEEYDKAVLGFKASSFYEDNNTTMKTKPEFPLDPGDSLLSIEDRNSDIYCPASAKEVIEWLKDRKIDIACVPQQAIDMTPSSARLYERVGNIADSASGCSLVFLTESCEKNPLITRLVEEIDLHFDRFRNSEQVCMSTRTLGYAMETAFKFAKNLDVPKVRIGYEEQTAAKSYFDHAFELGPGRLQGINIKDHIRTSGELGVKLPAEWLDHLLDEEVFGVVTWEPHASQLVALGKGKLKSAPLYFSLDPIAGQKHLTMDIMILSERSNDTKLLMAARQLMSRLEDAVYEVRNLHTTIIRAKWVADYYGVAYGAGGDDKVFSAEDAVHISRMLNRIRFTVSIDPAFHRKVVALYE